jgi:hypothetical protein
VTDGLQTRRSPVSSHRHSGAAQQETVLRGGMAPRTVAVVVWRQRTPADQQTAHAADDNAVAYALTMALTCPECGGQQIVSLGNGYARCDSSRMHSPRGPQDVHDGRVCGRQFWVGLTQEDKRRDGKLRELTEYCDTQLIATALAWPDATKTAHGDGDPVDAVSGIIDLDVSTDDAIHAMRGDAEPE